MQSAVLAGGVEPHGSGLGDGGDPEGLERGLGAEAGPLRLSRKFAELGGAVEGGKAVLACPGRAGLEAVKEVHGGAHPGEDANGCRRRASHVRRVQDV